MKKALPLSALFSVFFLLSPTSISAKVWINEFSSASDPEWVEIYNESNDDVELDNWVLKDTSKRQVELDGCVSGNSYRTFERSKGWLNDSGGDTVYLYNSEKDLVDSIGYGNEGDIGTPKNDESARREPPGSKNWVIDSNISKKDDNCELISPTNTPTNIPTESPTNTPTEAPKPTEKNTPTQVISYQDYDNIYISEVMADPEVGKEWVELYNDNDFQVDLDGWYIDDVAEGGGTPISISGLIDPKSYYAFEVATYFFNNTGDDVRLLNYKKEEKDFRTYDYSEKGISWADVFNSWCQAEPTKNLPNESCLQEENPTPTASNTPTLTPVQSPTLTPSITKTPTPTPDSSLTPTKNPSPTSASGLKSTPEVLGKSLDVDEDESESESKTKSNLVAGGFVSAGGLILAGAGFGPQIKSFFVKMKNNGQ